MCIGLQGEAEASLVSFPRTGRAQLTFRHEDDDVGKFHVGGNAGVIPRVPAPVVQRKREAIKRISQRMKPDSVN